jgi:hypothetical protein
MCIFAGFPDFQRRKGTKNQNVPEGTSDTVLRSLVEYVSHKDHNGLHEEHNDWSHGFMVSFVQFFAGFV